MRTEPADLDRAELSRLLAREWAFDAASLEYLPVGFGSHHWEASDGQRARRFVTADRLSSSWAGTDPESAFDALERAFRTAAALRDTAGLEFVVGPLGGRSGAFVHRLGDFAVAVFPFVQGEPAEEPALVLRMLGRLHAATKQLPPDLVRREDFEIPHRDTLLEALGDLDRPWTTGPFAERTRELLRHSTESLTGRLEAYDELADEVRRTSGPWVVTHGEPKSSNVIRDGRDALWLVDWDTVRLAPRERDLWMVLDATRPAGRTTSRPPGPATSTRVRCALYRTRWDLADIAAFVHLFRRAHEATGDTVESWGYLEGYLKTAGDDSAY